MLPYLSRGEGGFICFTSLREFKAASTASSITSIKDLVFTLQDGHVDSLVKRKWHLGQNFPGLEKWRVTSRI